MKAIKEKKEKMDMRPIQEAILSQIRRGCRCESEVITWIQASDPTPYSVKFLQSEMKNLIRSGRVTKVAGSGFCFLEVDDAHQSVFCPLRQVKNNRCLHPGDRVSRSTLSMTRNSPGPLVGSSFNPDAAFVEDLGFRAWYSDQD